MAETLVAEDGEEIDLVQADMAFAAAMAAPSPDEPEAPSPPDIPPVDPEAPFGRKIDGSPKLRPGGRPPKERPRVTSQPAVIDAKASKGPAPDYTEGLREFLAAVALGAAVMPIPDSKGEMRVRVRIQAQVIQQNEDGLAKGVAMTAQHAPPVRWVVEKLTQGGSAWVLPAALAILPFAMQTRMVWTSPVDTELAAAAERVETQAMAEFKAAMGITDEDLPQAA